MATNTNTTVTTATSLAARAACLLSKATALAVVEKAVAQAMASRRVYPAVAEDFGAQLGIELPLKTRDFVRVVSFLLQTNEKPLKGVISKRKGEILALLAELVGALTDTPPVALPAWAMPKERAKKAEEASAEATSVGTLEKANILAEAESRADKAEADKAEADVRQQLAEAIELILANAAALTKEQRAMLATVAATAEA